MVVFSERADETSSSITTEISRWAE